LRPQTGTQWAHRVEPASALWGPPRHILVIWGDDMGVHNVSAYNHGVMGYRTPNIDRIARSEIELRRAALNEEHLGSLSKRPMSA
jgi:hypothetical protein